MDPIFTIPFSEFNVIEQLSKVLKKKDGYSMYVPTSRQQKGVDFIIHNAKSNKIARVQVKGSRTYKKDDRHSLWYNNFIDRYEEGNADFYILFGLYPAYKNTKSISDDSFWKSIILVFTEHSMRSFLKKVLTRAGNKDRFFAFRFSNPSEVIVERGPKEYKMQSHLLANSIREIVDFLK
jgi:hypothetical protein